MQALFIQANTKTHEVLTQWITGEDVEERVKCVKETYERSSGWDDWVFEYILMPEK